MSKAIITEGLLTDIADAIRAKNGAVATYTPAQMAAAIAALQGNVQAPAMSGYGMLWNILAPLIDTSQVTNMSYILARSQNAQGSSSANEYNPDVSGWDVSHVTDMQGLFQYNTSRDFNPDVSDWDVSHVQVFTMMFGYCHGASFNPDLSDWVVSAAVTMESMFNGCYGNAFNPDVSGWDVSNVETLSYMFYNCYGATFNPDFSDWDTSSATLMVYMFSGCKGDAFAPNVTNFDLSHVTSIANMFQGCSGAGFNPDLTHWNVSACKMFNNLFSGCSGSTFSKIDLNGWTASLANSNCQNMFKDIATTVRKKIWIPSTFVPVIANTTYQPLAASPGVQGADVYTDAANATAMGWTNIHANFTVHYGTTHAQFLAL